MRDLTTAELQAVSGGVVIRKEHRLPDVAYQNANDRARLPGRMIVVPGPIATPVAATPA